MDAFCRDLGVRFLAADPEDHRRVGGDGGGGGQGSTQPALRSTLVHFNRHLQSGTEEGGVMNEVQAAVLGSRPPDLLTA